MEQMDRRTAEALFVRLENVVLPEYREECAMIIDTFLEEDFTTGECKRLIAYLMKRVRQEKREEFLRFAETKIGALSEET